MSLIFLPFYSNALLQSKAINLVRNLLTSHDWDDRLAESDQKARVASLYLPLIGIVLDALPLLYDWQSSTIGKLKLFVFIIKFLMKIID